MIWVANVAGAIIPIATVKASLTRTQAEPSNRFKCTSRPPARQPSLPKHYHFTKKRLNDLNIPLLVISSDMHSYQFDSQYGWGTELEDSGRRCVGWEQNHFHVMSWGQYWFSSVAHAFKFIVLCNTDRTMCEGCFKNILSSL